MLMLIEVRASLFPNKHLIQLELGKKIYKLRLANKFVAIVNDKVARFLAG